MGSSVTYRKVLVTTDFSELGDCAIAHAFAVLGAGGGTVVLCHVLERFELPNPLYAHYIPGRAMTPEERQSLREGLEKKLEARAAACVPPGQYEVVCRVVESSHSVHQAILETAAEEGADAIVISSHGHSGLSRLLLGSTAERVLRSATIPVLVVRSR
jgi:nucleotide-binding universal stress UspA family protein